MITIYLSSTYKDLKEYRQTVFEALRKAGYQVIAMEDYVAADKRPVDKCLADVAKADLYVGLFGFRYGYIPPTNHNNPDGLSITELEFRHAEMLGKPYLVFVADKKVSISREFDDTHTGEGHSGSCIKRLRDYLCRECMAGFFSEPYELVSLVQAAVTKKTRRIITSRHGAPRSPGTAAQHHLGHREEGLALSGPDALYPKVRTRLLWPGGRDSRGSRSPLRAGGEIHHHQR